MIIEKILNNNVVVSIDPKSKKEVILMGCGIAFKKQVGQEIDENRIEKRFTIDNKTMGDKVKKLINQIPDGIFQLAQDIIIHAEKTLKIKLDKQVYISLADHIAFCIKRYKKNIKIENELLHEIKRIHKEEFKIGLWAVEYINKRVNINLPVDEAGFIALHIVNAMYKETSVKSQDMTKIVNGVLNIIRDTFSIKFDDEDLNYDRLITHLKYFAKRVISKSVVNGEDDTFIDLVKFNYKESYECAIKIKEYIQKEYDYTINNDEIVYLTLHIHRIRSVMKHEEYIL
ncbi:BglG family transcription antiterminator LicT [Clostridium tarantellae]|uniref:PRD domain-containing protein n=1 Tax=Clostridium tarantellae TaxID=39493 RepID=A0A6I1MJM8_9CLOT|nr:PRD domain-containing protein [Clostridium tarantellae]MPQ43585.1 PRD domain-containing protein [Clostridium tarantellae]